MYKRLLYSFILTLLFLPLWSVNATGLSSAFGPASPLNTAATAANYNTGTSITGAASNVILILLSVLGIVFIFLLVYGGIEWMSAGGNESRKSKSQEIIRAAIIGLAVVLGAYAISYYVIKAVGTSLITP